MHEGARQFACDYVCSKWQGQIQGQAYVRTCYGKVVVCNS